MSESIVEYFRQQAVTPLLQTGGLPKVWPLWRTEIRRLAPTPTARQLFDLGDHLKDIFSTSKPSQPQNARNQSAVSSSGTYWEALVCWYLNLCCIGRRTVIIKHNAKLIPRCIADAITVNYNTFPTNTESDLIALTFPDKPEYCCDKDTIAMQDTEGKPIKPYKTPYSAYNISPVLEALCQRDFEEIEIHIIQCKTNWNDNAQIPMLWDAVYSATNFRSGITVGQNGYAIVNAKRFTYAFVTVPTVAPAHFTPKSVAVLRVRNLSGGNYWGMPSLIGVANSVKEMLQRNLSTGSVHSHLTTLQAALPALSTTYAYFGL
ncbi:hypothetical protein [uncultured Subdoligranulum sp.]|uniref:hypothetical protein n=1 Tax=uncultured Subdoligranulum sp. TaxID=512298 RepID=UPI0026159E7C|nr:hypothetical protein [uncultured Subdoligranulum sp.]